MLEILDSGNDWASVRLINGRHYGLSLSDDKELIVTSPTGRVTQGGNTERAVVNALRDFVISDALEGVSHKEIVPLLAAAGLFNKPRADFAYVAYWTNDENIDSHYSSPLYARLRVGHNAVIVTARRSRGKYTVGNETRTEYDVTRYAYGSETKRAMTLHTNELHGSTSEIGSQCKKAYERLVAETMTFGGRARYAYSND